VSEDWRGEGGEFVVVRCAPTVLSLGVLFVHPRVIAFAW
jgi:hypothetical protein